jgi:hypothetical protein
VIAASIPFFVNAGTYAASAVDCLSPGRTAARRSGRPEALGTAEAVEGFAGGPATVAPYDAVRSACST